MTSPHSLLTTKIVALLSSAPSRPILVALDGRCGSGKTTLAAQLAEAFPDSITVHTDDYYLPPADRVPGWDTIPCANMDLARLRAEVLEPARRGSHFFIKPTPAGRARTCRPVGLRPGAARPRARAATPPPQPCRLL